MRRVLVFALGLIVLGLALLAYEPPSRALFLDTPLKSVSSGGGATIAFDAAADLTNNGGSGNFSHSYTSGSGSNRLLVLCVIGDLATNSDSNPQATYNSVSMVKDITHGNSAGGTDRWTYMFHLLAPATGANTVSVTQTGGGYMGVLAADYTGVGQTSQPDNTASSDTGSGSASSITTNITINTVNSWAVTCAESGGGGSGGLNGSNTTSRAFDGAHSSSQMNDSNAALSTGTFGANMAFSASEQLTQTVVSFHP